MSIRPCLYFQAELRFALKRSARDPCFRILREKFRHLSVYPKSLPPNEKNAHSNRVGEPALVDRKHTPEIPETLSKRELLNHWIEQLKSPPNLITSLRVVSIPYLSYLIASNQYDMVLYGCLLAGASDVLDGFLARRFNMTTVLGSYLDPFADKVLINALAVSLSYVGILPIPFVGLVVLRDITLITGTYLHVKANTTKGNWVMDPVTTPLQVNATPISKLNTGLQFLTLSIAVIQPVYGTDPQLLEYACWLTGGTTIASAFSYVGHSAFSETRNRLREKLKEKLAPKSSSQNSKKK